MAETAHPCYLNPTIQEAIAEVHFQLPSGMEWTPAFAGEFIKRVQYEFPKFEPLTDVGLRLGFSPKGVEQTQLAPRQRYRFTHASLPIVLQLVENAFTVNILAPYPGWPQMREGIGNAWEHLISALEISEITRVGLRFINRIPLTEDMQKPSHWLKANYYLSPSVLESVPPYFSRAEVRTDTKNAWLVILAYVPPTLDNVAEKYGAVIFDIDRTLDLALSRQTDKLLSQIDSLHEDVWQVFVSAKNDTLEAFLKGGEGKL